MAMLPSAIERRKPAYSPATDTIERALSFDCPRSRQLACKSAILDGEAIVQDEPGSPTSRR